MTNSRDKGARGERELARWLTERGHPARRGQQFKGGADSPDVICPSLPFHIECKRTERFNAYSALEQAQADCGDKPALVCHRRNGKPWLAVLRLDDLLTLIRGIQS